MRLAAALIYLSSVARVAAIGYGFPSVKSTAAKLALGIWARGYNGTDRENSQYEVVSSHSITLRRPCEVARTNDGNSVLVLATFSEPQRL